MAPPLAGQVGFLESLDSIDEMQFREALRKLEQRRAPAPAAAQASAPSSTEPASSAAADALAAELPNPPAPPRQARTSAKAPSSAPADGLLLKDASLEDIVRHLQERNIEPTFRFLTPR
jgi:hypothetical protein